MPFRNRSIICIASSRLRFSFIISSQPNQTVYIRAFRIRASIVLTRPSISANIASMRSWLCFLVSQPRPSACILVAAGGRSQSFSPRRTARIIPCVIRDARAVITSGDLSAKTHDNPKQGQIVCALTWSDQLLRLSSDRRLTD